MSTSDQIASHLQRAVWLIEGAENQIKCGNWIDAHEAIHSAIRSIEEARMHGMSESIQTAYEKLKVLNSSLPDWAQLKLK